MSEYVGLSQWEGSEDEEGCESLFVVGTLIGIGVIVAILISLL